LERNGMAQWSTLSALFAKSSFASMIGRNGRANGRWCRGQSALLMPAADLLPLPRAAVLNGTIRKEDRDGGQLI